MQNCIFELDNEISKDCNLVYNANLKYESYLRSEFYFEFINNHINEYFWKSKYLLELLLNSPAELFEDGYFFNEEEVVGSISQLGMEYTIIDVRRLFTVDHEAKFDFNFKSFISWLSYIKPATPFISKGELVNFLIEETENRETNYQRVMMNLALLVLYTRCFKESEIEITLVYLVFGFSDFLLVKDEKDSKLDIFRDYKDDLALFLFYASIYKEFDYQTDDINHFLSSFQIFKKFFPDASIIGYTSTVEMCIENIKLRERESSPFNGDGELSLAVVKGEKFVPDPTNELYRLVTSLRSKFPVNSLKVRLIDFIKNHHRDHVLPLASEFNIKSGIKLDASLSGNQPQDGDRHTEQLSKINDEEIKVREGSVPGLSLSNSPEFGMDLKDIEDAKRKDDCNLAKDSDDYIRNSAIFQELYQNSLLKDRLIRLKEQRIRDLKHRLTKTYEQQLYLYNHGKLAVNKGYFLLTEEMKFKSFMRLIGAPPSNEEDDSADADLILLSDPDIDASFRHSLSYTNTKVAQNVYKFYMNNQNAIFKRDDQLKTALKKMGVYFEDDKDDNEDQKLYHSEIEGRSLRELERDILSRLDNLVLTRLELLVETYKNSDDHKMIQKCGLIPEMSSETVTNSGRTKGVEDLLRDIKDEKEVDENNSDDQCDEYDGDKFWKVATELSIAGGGDEGDEGDEAGEGEEEMKKSGTPSAEQDSSDNVLVNVGNDDGVVKTQISVDVLKNVEDSNGDMTTELDLITTKNVEVSNVSELGKDDVIIGISDRQPEEDVEPSFKRQKLA